MVQQVVCIVTTMHSVAEVVSSAMDWRFLFRLHYSFTLYSPRFHSYIA